MSEERQRLRSLRLEAHKGNHNAQAEYAIGIGFRQSEGYVDCAPTAEYLRISAEQGNVFAQFNYATCLQLGEGVERDLAQAARFYCLSSESGNAMALNSYAAYLETGSGIEPDLVKAAEMYRRAANCGHPYGLFNYGRCLEFGMGVDVNLGKAAQLYRRASETGYDLSYVSHCIVTGQPCCDVERVAKAVKECNDAIADPLHVTRQFYRCMYGRILEAGVCGEVDLVKAASEYRESAESGYAPGEYLYGLCLECGKGVEVDLDRAILYYRHASSVGHHQASKRLHDLTHSGK